MRFTIFYFPILLKYKKKNTANNELYFYREEALTFCFSKLLELNRRIISKIRIVLTRGPHALTNIDHRPAATDYPRESSGF